MSADQGKYAETKVKQHLDKLKGKFVFFDFERIPDARSGRGSGKNKVGDFQFFSAQEASIHGAIDSKELSHDYLLPKGNVSQLPKMQRRSWAGGQCGLIIFHTRLKLWRVAHLDWLIERRNKPSWDLRELPLYESHTEALTAFFNKIGIDV